MIKGKAKLEFGTGDIRFTGCLSYGVGALCLITQDKHHVIGERIPVSDTWNTKEAEVIMTFTQVASIDALIAGLNDVKDYMEGKFPDDQTFSDEKFDFDSFMNPPVQKKFSVGDSAWFTVTPGDKRNPRRSKRTEPMGYKVLQVIQTSKKHGIQESYNTKDGGFYECEIGVTVFHSREEALANL